MPNVRISQAADAGTLLSSDMVPLARSGNTNAYHATMTEIATFTNASLSSGAYGNVGRNLLHNSLFNIAQRGAGVFNSAGYTLDRWRFDVSGDTTIVQQVAFGDANRAAIGDEAAIYGLNANVTGTSGAGAFTTISQFIEGVRRLAGKTVTISLWAYAASGTPKLGVALQQYFGAGGSPSATVSINGQATPALSATATRYSFTFTLPSVSGMTLGTSGNDYTRLALFFSSGATNNTFAGGIGVQTGNFVLWGIQLEIGAQATPLEKPDPQQDLAKCQRFYQVGNFNVQGAAYVAGGFVRGTWQFPVTPRAQMTVTPNFATNSNVTSAAAGSYGVDAITVGGSATAAGNWALQGTFTASADL